MISPGLSSFPEGAGCQSVPRHRPAACVPEIGFLIMVGMIAACNRMPIDILEKSLQVIGFFQSIL